MTYITSYKWNKLSYTEQILNIGGEIQRAVDNRNAKKEESIVEQHYEFLGFFLNLLSFEKSDIIYMIS